MNWNELSELMDSITDRFGIPACECLVTIGHDRVFYRASGFSDVKKTHPVSERDLYWIYSLSKIFTCTAALQLIERGLMKLNDPVSKFLPSWTNLTVKKGTFSVPCETQPTILNLMTMTCGLNYNLATPGIVRLIKETNRKFSLRQVIDVLAREPLDFVPGEHFQYSLCHDVLGAVIEQASGMMLEDYLRENIKEPLGAADLTFFPNKEQFSRFSTEYIYREKSKLFTDAKLKNPFLFSPAFASGGAGICSNILDVSLLADALANGGVAATGKTILSENSINEMRKNWLTPEQQKDFNIMKPGPFCYGLGVQTLTSPVADLPAGEFGWDGAAGSFVLMDPNLRLSLVYTQHVLDHRYLVHTQLHPALRETLYRIVMNG